MENRLKIWKVAFDNDIRFVSGPQSIYYQATSGAAIYDQRFVKYVANQRDLITFRQRDSYEYALAHYDNFTNVKECPDMAFMLGSQTPSSNALYDVFLLMRRDSESQFGAPESMHNQICNGIAEEGFSCGFGDWGVSGHRADEDVSTFTEIGLEVALESISKGELIVTDRLHGALFAFLAGKYVIYVDNVYDKITQSLSAAFDHSDHCSNEETLGVFEVSENIDEIVTSVLKYLRKYGRPVQVEESANKVETMNRM